VRFICLATCCIVSSKDLHLSLHSGREFKDVNLSTLRMLLLADRANPCMFLLNYTSSYPPSLPNNLFKVNPNFVTLYRSIHHFLFTKGWVKVYRQEFNEKKTNAQCDRFFYKFYNLNVEFMGGFFFVLFFSYEFHYWIP